MESSELITLLERNGLSRTEARALSVFVDGQGRTSARIESEAGLRQPEVSVAMNSFVARGWFRQATVKKVGKGRPSIVYHLAKPFSEICDDIAGERGRDIAGMMNDLNALRAVMA